MNHDKLVWVNHTTPINESNLNRIEESVHKLVYPHMNLSVEQVNAGYELYSEAKILGNLALCTGNCTVPAGYATGQRVTVFTLDPQARFYGDALPVVVFEWVAQDEYVTHAGMYDILSNSVKIKLVSSDSERYFQVNFIAHVMTGRDIVVP